MQKRLLNVDEAAQYLGVKRGTLYAWTFRKKISNVKMGSRLLFDIRDLNKMIKQGKRNGTFAIAQ